MHLALNMLYVTCTPLCLYLRYVEGNSREVRCHLNCSNLWPAVCHLFLYLVSEASLIDLNYLDLKLPNFYCLIFV